MDDEQSRATLRQTISRERNRHGVAGRIVGTLVLLLLVAIFVVPFFFYSAMTGPMGSYTYPYFFFPFGSIIIVFVILFAIRWLFWGWGWRGGYGRGYWGHRGYGDAEEIVRQRYAKGEITKEQFDQMIRDLRAHNA